VFATEVGEATVRYAAPDSRLLGAVWARRLRQQRMRLPGCTAVHNDRRVDKPWMVNELAHAGPEHLDPAFVAGFDRKQGHPDPAGDIAALHAHGLDATSTVVDLGAGTGRFALAAAREFGQVIAVDISAPMLSQLRRQADAAGLANLDCVHAGFLSYQHAGPPADAVFTRHALHQLPDFWKAVALDRIARLLRPGGVLRLRDLIYDFSPGEADEVFGRWLADAADDPAVGYTAEEYATHIRTEHSTFRWLFEPMLTMAGFEIVTVTYRDSRYGSYTCLSTLPPASRAASVSGRDFDPVQRTTAAGAVCAGGRGQLRRAVRGSQGVPMDGGRTRL
jgi:ubiquinone/menaquinone biosynthesis C-methylase UbiE